MLLFPIVLSYYMSTGNKRLETLQEKLLLEVRNRFEKQSAMVSALSQLLSVNRDGVYRRLRGDTSLNAEEVQILANHFGISIDGLLAGHQKKTYFFYNHYQQPITAYLPYLEQIYAQIRRFSEQPTFRVYYASKEVPILIYYQFPRLLAFKLYVYGISTWQFPELENQRFHFDLLSAQELEVAKAAAKLYCQVDSSDFWPLSILEPFLNQVEYLTMAEKFAESGIAVQICQELLEMIQHVRQMAEIGRKYLYGEAPSKQHAKFELFYNELASTNNTILGVSDNLSGLFHTLDTPNFLFTTDPQLCGRMKEWFEQMVGHSTAISIHSERDRNFYFNRLEEKVQQTIERVEFWVQRSRTY